MSPLKLRSNLVFYFSILFFLQIEISSTSEKWSENDCYQNGDFFSGGVCTVINIGNKTVSYNETEKLCEKLIPGGRPVILIEARSRVILRLMNGGCKGNSCVFWIGLQQTMPGEWKWIDGTDAIDWNFTNTQADQKCVYITEMSSDSFTGESWFCDRKILITHTICQASIEPDPLTFLWDLAVAAVAIFCLSFGYMFRREICVYLLSYYQQENGSENEQSPSATHQDDSIDS